MKNNTYLIPQTQSPRARPVTPAAIIAPLFLLAGTAGMYHPQAVARLADFSPNPIILVNGRESRRQNTSQKLLKARAALGLSMTEFAELFGVSRTAVYDWIRGAKPKSEIAYQIELLESYTTSTANMDFGRPSLLGRNILVQVRSGRSLEHVISSEVPHHDQKKPIARKLGFGKVAHDVSSFSELVTPITFERT